MKKYTVKQYDKGGTFKGTLGDLSSYNFSSKINGGLGQLSIEFPRPFDQQGDIAFLDTIEVWVQDVDAPNGVLVYSGYVDEIISEVNGLEEKVVVNCLGFVARLGYTLDISGTSISIARNSQDPEDSVKDVIDNYNALVDNPKINYATGSTEAVGYNVSYTSNSKMCLESIEAFRELSEGGRWWYVGADNVFQFKARPVTTTHSFIMGKDITAISIRKTVGQITNNLIFWNGLQSEDTNYISKRYESPSSVTSYWHRFDRKTDGRVTVSATADSQGQATIDENKEPFFELTVTIKDNNYGDGYDIESVKVGDTFKILNLRDIDLYSNNLQITGIEYNPEYIVVSAETSRDLTSRTITDLNRQIDLTTYGDGASTVTYVDVD